MGQVIVTIQGADGTQYDVVMDGVTGSDNNYPVYKTGFGALGENAVLVSPQNPLPVDGRGIGGTVDAGNSTTTPLLANATFTGTALDTIDVASIVVFVFADQASATDGMIVEWSTDGTNWDEDDTFTIPKNDGKTFSFQAAARYMRIVYTNGGTDQGAFRLQTITKTAAGRGSSHRISDNVSGEDDAELVKAIITGENPGGTFVNFTATTAGNFKVSLEEVNGVQLPVTDPYLDIAEGNITGQSQVNKFGGNPSIAADTTEDIWDGGGTYSFPATADITHISQAVDQVAMRGQTIEVQGLDTNWALIVQSKALDATDTTTAVSLDTALRRVFRMKVLANVVADSDISAKNSGGGTTYATMQAGNNQTLMAIYTVPAGKTAYMTCYYADVVEGTGKQPTSTEFKLWVADRNNSYEFQLKHARGIPKAGPGFEYCFKPYFKIGEKNDIKVSATSVDEEGVVHAGFDLILVDD
jgi:hypothetical protein